MRQIVYFCLSSSHFCTFHTLFYFLPLQPENTTETQGSENYSQSSSFFIFCVLYSLLKQISFPSTAPSSRWPFREMHKLRQTLLLIQGVFWILQSRIKWWAWRQGRPSGSFYHRSFVAFARPKLALCALYLDCRTLSGLPFPRCGCHHPLCPRDPFFQDTLLRGQMF